MKTINEAFEIITGSKRFNFEYGEHGSTVLVISSYYTGEELRLDLGNINEEILEALQVEESNEDGEDW